MKQLLESLVRGGSCLKYAFWLTRSGQAPYVQSQGCCSQRIPLGNFPLKSSLPAEFSTCYCLHFENGGMLVFLGSKEGYPENTVVLSLSRRG